MLSWAGYGNKPGLHLAHGTTLVFAFRIISMWESAGRREAGRLLVWSAEEDAKAAVEHSKPHQNGDPTMVLVLVGT